MAFEITPSAIPGYVINTAGTTFEVDTVLAAHTVLYEADGDFLVAENAEENSTPVFSVHAESVKISPDVPVSGQTRIRAYAVKGIDASAWTEANCSISGYAAEASSSGISAWNSRAVKDTSIPNSTTANFFIQATADSKSSEKLIGFIGTASTQPAAATPQTENFYGFQLKDNGNLYVICNEVFINEYPLAYQAGDIFRVEKKSGKFNFSKNGKVLHQVEIPSTFPAAAWAVIGFSSDEASFSDVVTYVPQSTVANGYNETQGLIKIYSICPGQPQYGIKLTRDNQTIVSNAEDGSRVFRQKSKIRTSLSLQYNQRSWDEFKEMLDFWNHHQRHIPFIYRDISKYDTTEYVDYLVTFENQFEYTVEGPNSVTWSLALKEV